MDGPWSLGKGVYRLASYMKNDEWGYALLFNSGKLFSEIGNDKNSSSDDGGDKVESPLLGLPCAVRKEDGLTMREIDDDSIEVGKKFKRGGNVLPFTTIPTPPHTSTCVTFKEVTGEIRTRRVRTQEQRK